MRQLHVVLALALFLAGAASAIAPEDRSGAGAQHERVWLAGDWHVHTSASHDACHPANATGFVDHEHPQQGIEDGCGDGPHTLSAPGWARMLEAEARGLDYLRITDHNTLSGAREAQAGYDGPVTFVPGYEDSLPGGHAGITSLNLLERGLFHDPADPSGIQGVIDAVHQEPGGLFVANHPYDGGPSVWTTDAVDWSTVDAIEVWNIHWLWRDDLFGPFVGTSNNDRTLALWTELLDAGYRLPVVGGSDNHWLATTAIQGPGQPTTWVHAANDTPRAIVEAVQEGRTYVAWDNHAPRVQLTATGPDGSTVGIGGTLSPGQVHVQARVQAGEPSRLRVVSCEGVLADRPAVAYPSGTSVEAELPAGCWLRLDVVTVDDAGGQAPDDLLYRAVTSPIYVR